MSTQRLGNNQRIPFKDKLLMAVIDNRKYSRNESFYASVAVLGVGYGLTALSILLFNWLYIIPEFLLLPFFMIVLLGWLPVRHANVVKWGGLFNLVVGIIGLVFHLQFGLSIMGNHYEPMAFTVIAIGGVLSMCRRAFNHWVWKTHDRLVKQYGYSKRAA